MILIGCRGGDPDAPRLLQREGWKYGARSDYKIYDWPYFIDIEWRNYDWGNHLAVIREWSPKMAMVADYEQPSQRTNMLQQCDDIRAIGLRPMVCPKFPGAAKDIPKDAIVAVSVPTSYAGYLPSPSELIGRELHFLGGHPDQYVILQRRYSKASVISADCSTIFQKAQHGAFWSAKKNTWREVRNRFHTHALMQASARNIKRYLLNPPQLFLKNRKRLKRVGFELRPSLFN